MATCRLTGSRGTPERFGGVNNTTQPSGGPRPCASSIVTWTPRLRQASLREWATRALEWLLLAVREVRARGRAARVTARPSTLACLQRPANACRLCGGRARTREPAWHRSALMWKRT